MKIDDTRISICPLCGKTYHGYPALSRTDNRTPICPDCGVRQALSSIGVSAEEQEKILGIIHGREPERACGAHLGQTSRQDGGRQ
ncbi:MAG: hypothetical protein IJH09_00380 [Clostridia bacterium]|nr:hypothetical protein [Clostridia bacterium]